MKYTLRKKCRNYVDFPHTLKFCRLASCPWGPATAHVMGILTKGYRLHSKVAQFMQIPSRRALMGTAQAQHSPAHVDRVGTAQLAFVGFKGPVTLLPWNTALPFQGCDRRAGS